VSSFELTTRMQCIKRSAGRSATAAVAYRAADRIHCDREGRTHDYTRKQGVERSGIELPEGSPEMTRAELWNLAEQRETRRNSQTAREYLISLPHEISPAGRVAVVREVSRHMVDRFGVAVDWSLHEPGRDGDERNFHAHIMLTTRRMSVSRPSMKARHGSATTASKTVIGILAMSVSAPLSINATASACTTCKSVRNRSASASAFSGYRKPVHARKRSGRG
jgi:hypothetical protein